MFISVPAKPPLAHSQGACVCYALRDHVHGVSPQAPSRRPDPSLCFAVRIPGVQEGCPQPRPDTIEANSEKRRRSQGLRVVRGGIEDVDFRIAESQPRQLSNPSLEPQFPSCPLQR